jgi:hypothetical protein
MPLSALSVLEPATETGQWRQIPDWPHEASYDGRIRRIPWIDASGCLHVGGEIALCPDKRKGKGYLYATLRDGERRRKAHVAVLVLEAWVGPKPGPEYEACHSGARTDNHVAKLRWDTKEANLAEMWEQRRSRAMTRLMTDGPADGLQCHQPQVTARISVAPRLSPASVTSDRPHGTGSLPIPSISPSHSLSVQPSSRSLRSLVSRRVSRKAA